MYCCSTKNQTVNLIPAIQFKIDLVIDFTTTLAVKEKYHDRMAKILKNRKVQIEKIEIPIETEKSINLLSKQILEKFNDVDIDDEIFINISGGQKPFALAFFKAFNDCNHSNCRLVYTEGNNKEIFCADKKLNQSFGEIKANLKLIEMLSLYGFQLCNNPTQIDVKEKEEEIIEKANQAGKFLIEDGEFAQLFIRILGNSSNQEIDWRKFLDSEWLRKKIIEKVKPKLDQLQIQYSGYEDVSGLLRDLIEFEKNPQAIPFEKLKKISNNTFVYDGYWNAVKKAISEHICDHLKNEILNPEAVFELPKNDNGKQLAILKEQLEKSGLELTGEIQDGIIKSKNIRFPKDEKKGIYFENMIHGQLLVILRKRQDLLDQISEIFKGVKTSLETELKSNSSEESEYDFVLVTKFGTLIMIEAKSAVLDRDAIKGKELGAIQKSGPYGKNIVIGPLVKSLKEMNGNPQSFVPSCFRDHEKRSKEIDVEYSYFDELEIHLEKHLKP